jgi:hypothetical protein
MKNQTITIINGLLILLIIVVIGYLIRNHIKIKTQHLEKFEGDQKIVGTVKIIGSRVKNTVDTIYSAVPSSHSSAPVNEAIPLITTSQQTFSSDEPENVAPSSILTPSPSKVATPTHGPSELNDKEKRIFDAFLEKRITDDKIQELIESGILTEHLVEKFLSMIDDLPEGPPVTRAPKKNSTQYTVEHQSKNDNLIEGFYGGSGVYASRLF